MGNEFVPYEQALALKELGFDEPCFGLYAPPCKTISLHHYGLLTAKEQISAPLYQQAFRWFEKTYGLFVDRKTMCSVNEVMGMDYFIRSINGTWQVEFPADYSEFDSYKANTACVQKLIEIVKSKK